MAEETAQLTIKAVPVEVRYRMLALAKRRGLTQAQWLTSAVDMMERIQAGDAIERKPAAAPAPAALSMHDLAEAMLALKATREATGAEPPQSLSTHAYRLIGARLRGALPRPEPRPATLQQPVPAPAPPPPAPPPQPQAAPPAPPAGPPARPVLRLPTPMVVRAPTLEELSDPDTVAQRHDPRFTPPTTDKYTAEQRRRKNEKNRQRLARKAAEAADREARGIQDAR